ncbi:MAG: hypothetical protein MZV63_30105 [Marinilabiliales bacterium]|nr:hypothetical protein [Marinilabiliales bacterium]
MTYSATRCPFLALTATATPQVVKDIVSRLKLKNPRILQTSFRRTNITYVVREVEDKSAYVLRSLKKETGQRHHLRQQQEKIEGGG